MTRETTIAAFVVAVAVDGSGVLPPTRLSGPRQALEDVASAITYEVVVNYASGPQTFTRVVPDHQRPNGDNPSLLIRSARVGDVVGISFVDDGSDRRIYMRIAEGIALVDECPAGGP